MSYSSVRPKRKLLVTGGLGFIGANVVRKFHRDFDIVVLDWKASPQAEQEVAEFRRLGVSIYHADIATPETWRHIEPCEYIFHAAAQVSAVASETDPVRDFQSNVFGTFLVAEYARRHSARVIYCNSIRVYETGAIEAAMRKHGVVSEDCPTVNRTWKPQPPFAISKLMGEQYLLGYARMHSVPVISLRMSGVVGAGQIGSKVHGWISHLVGCAVDGVTFTIYGDGKQSRDILHISDYLDLIRMALNDFDFLSDKGGAVYNIGGGPSNELSIEQVTNLLRKEYDLNLVLAYEDFRPSEPKHYISDNSLIAKKGWYPRRTNSQSLIREIVDWHVRRKGNGIADP